MSDMSVQPVAEAVSEGRGLTQWQRVSYTFSRAVEDV